MFFTIFSSSSRDVATTYFLFLANTKNKTITNMAVYGVYRRVCNKLGIPISKDLIRGPHSLRRNAITDVANATNGNMVMPSNATMERDSLKSHPNY